MRPSFLRRHAPAWLTTAVSLVAVVACADLRSAGEDTPPGAPGSTVLGNGASESSGGTGADGGSASSSSPSSSGTSGTSSTSSSSSSTSSSGASGTSGANPWTSFGPGPDGPLPTGVCCTKSADCRSGVCAEVGTPGETVFMCADRCNAEIACKRPSTNMVFTCHTQQQLCAIDAFESVRCIPRDQHTVGTKPLGACCTVRADADNGLECASGVCVADGGGPGVCTRTCAKAADCATGFTCAGAPTGRCVPAGAYGCQ